MDDPAPALALLNVYEVDAEGVRRHLVCFLDPVLAGARGIDPRSVVGEYVPGPNDEFDVGSFSPSPGFVEAFAGYMNEEATRSADLISAAVAHASGWLYVLDPRYAGAEDDEPPATDLLGAYAVDAAGRIVPDSFTYNEEHRWFDPASGVSGVLSDRRFYDWLHPMPGAS